MIIDNIKNLENFKYYDSNDEIKAALEFMKSVTTDLEIGRHEITDRSFAKIQSYETKDRENCKFEAHDIYADIQFIVSGEESIDVCDVRTVEEKENKLAEKDVVFYGESTDYTTLKLHAGDFVILFPWEIHRPGIATDGKKANVFKAVVKVKLK